MAMIQFIVSGVWKIELDPFITEDMVVETFETLFRIELKKESLVKFGSNPYDVKGIPNIDVHMDESDYSYFLNEDNKSFLSCLISGLTNELNEKKLCFNLEHQGVAGHYFKYLKEGNKKWVEMKSLFTFQYTFDDFPNQNIRRLIVLLYERLFPFIKSWEVDEELIDYEIINQRKLKDFFLEENGHVEK